MHSLNNLLGSIQQSIKLKGSLAREQVLKGSILQYNILKASVVTFVENLSIRGILTPIVSLTALATIFRRAKGILTPVVSLTARGKGLKNAKAIITPIVSITANAKSFKNMIQTLYIRPIIGRYKFLSELDIFNLLPLDPQTLFDLEFLEGVKATVRKNSKGVIINTSELSASAIMVQYTKLGDMDGFTLATFDPSTLKVVQETLV
jgi:hypothetical protein